MAKKSKFAFGQSGSIESAKQANKIDNFDILLLDGTTDPKIGWIDGQGNTVIVPNHTDLSGVEAELATKATTKEVDEKLASKANAEDVETLESQMATKVDASTVQSMINEATVGVIEVVEF